MNIQIQTENTALNPHVFRAADRMRIDGCANAVAHEGLSLALYCPYEALLDHYLNLLLARLRQQAPEHRIEVYFPANTDSLLGRFNEVLASQSLNQAVKASASAQQAQIWLVHDAQTLPESEIQLLARLIQNFPGANIRAILLMSGSTHGEKSPLSAFGRKILRWDIEAPTPEQAQAALEAARHEGHFNATQQLIQRIQRQQLPELNASFHAAMAPATEAPAETPPAPQSALRRKVQAFHQRGTSAIASLRQTGKGLGQSLAWVRQNSKLTLGVVFALLMSTLMMLWIQPEAFGLKSAKPLAPAALKSPATPTEPTAQTTPTTTAPEATPNAPATAAKSAEAAPPASAEDSQRTPALMAKTPAEPAIEAPEATQDAQAWARKLDANSFLLQHGTANVYEKVLDIQRKHPALKNAQIVAAYRPGEKLAHFVIVSGPFSDVGQGYEAAKRPGIPRSWVRHTRSLQEQLKSPT